MRIKSFIIGVGVTMLTAAIAFPYVCGFLSQPVGLTSFSKAENQMTSVAAAIKDYKVTHRQLPPSRSEFLRFLQAQPRYREASKCIKSSAFQFHSPVGSQDRILVSCYLPYQSRKTLLWIDQNGAM